MGDITKNISRHEIACKCGCGFDTIDYVTAYIVQSACDHFAKKLGVDRVYLYITSACRCLIYNISVGGAEHSYHPKARAIDHTINGVKPQALYEYYDNKYPDQFGVGLYTKENFVHFDSRSGRWRRRVLHV
jgi:uncharacterized protein YcbK (DUF882 family)